MRELICINCPLGCNLKVDDSNLDNIIVTGNTCPRGAKYGKDEVLSPKRMVTSSVKVNDGMENVVSCKTREAIPKGLIFDLLEELKKVTLDAPVKIGDVIIENALNTGIDVIATRNIERK